MRVGAIENRGLVFESLASPRLRPAGDEIGGKQGFVFAIGRVVKADLAAALARRPQILSLALEVVGDNGGGCLEDGLGGAVVLLEADDLGLGKILFKVEDVIDVGSAPGVNRLVLIADGTEVMVGSGQGAHDLVLRTVGVLILIDEHVLVSALILLASDRVGLEQADALQQEIVEVEGVGLEQLVFVNFVDVGDALHLGLGGVQVHLLRVLHVVLGRRDEAEDAARCELFVVDAETLDGRLDDLLLIALVVDDEVAGVAFAVDLQGLDVPAQHAHAERVKGADGRLGERVLADELMDALGHFGSGLVGEGHGQDAVGGQHSHAGRDRQCGR